MQSAPYSSSHSSSYRRQRLICLLTDRLSLMLLYGSGVAVASSVSGYYLAVIWNVSIGGMMAVMTGVFLILSFLFGPRYGLIAQAMRRRGLTQANQCRTLAVHLYNHEAKPDQGDENVAQALKEHLRWDAAKSNQVLLRSIDQGLVVRDGNLLRLTPQGREVAREILEPWRMGAAATSAH